MHLEDEVTLLKAVDPPDKIYILFDIFLWSIRQHCSEICILERDLLLGLKRTDFH